MTVRTESVPALAARKGLARAGLVGRLLEDRGAGVGFIILLTVAFTAISAPVLAPHDPNAQALSERGMPPAWLAGGSSAHLLGTDNLGRDVLSRVMWAARISLVVGLAATLLAGLLGVTTGMLAGYYSGPLDDVMSRLVDMQLAIPLILLSLALLAALGSSLHNVVLVLAIGGWVFYARVVRSQVLSLRERGFVEALRAAGASDARIMFGHLLPNVMGSIIVIATLEIGHVIVLEGSLSFLGLGIRPPDVSWGSMLSDGRSYLTQFWWIATFPGLALTVTVLSCNLIGDWLRDVFDPRMRR